MLIESFLFAHRVIVQKNGSSNFDQGVVDDQLQYRMVEVEKGTPKKNIVQIREYKLNLGTILIEDNEEESDDDGEFEFEELQPQHKNVRF
ncbi:hypothetical protein HHI36_005827 [Cryptolaemus montrouzieri]|uniref:Uncharacterized protein n=1 Tax=Cryptolaemus montrouzieri TaxID=559131 RepID=A0ABD2NVC1_9CUCU